MLDFNAKQRAVLIEKLPDLANLAVGALVFGQLLGDDPVSWALVGIGLGMWFALVTLALYLGRRNRP